jgi:hypothetical protein
MKIFSILKIDDEYSVMHYPSDRLKLDPRAVSPNQYGVATTPLDGVSVLLIQDARCLIPILVKIFFVYFTFSGKKGSNESNLTHNPI